MLIVSDSYFLWAMPSGEERGLPTPSIVPLLRHYVIVR